MSEPFVAARSAAVRAGVEVLELCELDRLAEAAALLSVVWRDPTGASTVPVDLLRALQVSGNYVAGAVAEDERLVGAAVAWATPEGVLHSHLAAVLPESKRSGVGMAMKLHQRAWALSRDIHTVTWTFDPLVRRNSSFNLRRLGAVVSGYAVNLYGRLTDDLSGDDETDRLLVAWHLRSSPAAAAADGERLVVQGSHPARLVVADDGRPRQVSLPLHCGRFTVAIPADIEDVRLRDRHLASQWRKAVRDVLGSHLAGGGEVLGLDDEYRYVCANGEVADG